MDTSEVISDILEHHGVKGQKWGVRRKATVGPQEVVVRDSRFPGSKRLVAKGGGGHPATESAKSARAIGQIAKKSGTKALTDDELRQYANRIQLEQNVSRLRYADANPGRKFVMSMSGQGKKAGSDLAKQTATHNGKKALIKAGLLAAA